MAHKNFSPEYNTSRALIIGIDKYKSASPLSYAVSDAKAMHELLVSKFNFSKDNIVLLLDSDASRENIMQEYLKFADEKLVHVDDKILVFYAGHGHTIPGKRGEVGYLVPFNGDLDSIASLIRWDELTRNADLLPAKHVFFIMDACYGGLAITRSLQPGSKRFLKDMLQRYSRQVLTAGKADEVVSDSGGPIPKHSVFTGHLIEALGGKARSQDGILTANGVMAYVYDHVSRDQYSRQTPHYGYVEGDGDFIFEMDVLSELTKDKKIDEDILISIPELKPQEEMSTEANTASTIKELMSDPKSTIKLHDLIMKKTREVIAASGKDEFPVQGTYSKDQFIERINRYEEIIRDLKISAIVLTYWGEDAHINILLKALSRLADELDRDSGLVPWLVLRWYPLIILTYCIGIAALAAGKHKCLDSLFKLEILPGKTTAAKQTFILSIGNAVCEYVRGKLFSQIPGHEKYYTPLSEYLFKRLQPDLDDQLFLGNDYGKYFDNFEVLLALCHADIEERKHKDHIWGPVGRFGWKYYSYDSEKNAFRLLREDAKLNKSDWPPIKAGLFAGSSDRFEEIADKYENLLKTLGWH